MTKSTQPPLRKGLGQHHLRQPHLCAPAVEFLRARDRLVVEVGPGGGVLTAELLAAGARVVAWELDPAWAFAAALRRRGEALRVVVGDAMAAPWQRLPPGSLVAGNLPYAIATALIDAVLDHGDRIPRAAFLVQEEVADRLLAGPGSTLRSAAGVLVQARARITLLARVKPGSFRPRPKVAGAFIGLDAAAGGPPPVEFGAFSRLVRAGFSQRRKQLRNALGASLGADAAAAVLGAAGLDGAARAQDLGLAEWVSLHRSALALRLV